MVSLSSCTGRVHHSLTRACTVCLQSALFNFQSLLLVILLLICTCTYVRAVAPRLIDRNKEGYVRRNSVGFRPPQHALNPACRFLGLFWMSARIGEPTSSFAPCAAWTPAKHYLAAQGNGCRHMSRSPVSQWPSRCSSNEHQLSPSHPASASRRDARSTMHTEPCCHAALRAPPGHHGLLKACVVRDVALVLLMRRSFGFSPNSNIPAQGASSMSRRPYATLDDARGLAWTMGAERGLVSVYCVRLTSSLDTYSPWTCIVAVIIMPVNDPTATGSCSCALTGRWPTSWDTDFFRTL